MAGNGETERPVDGGVGFIDADARGHQGLGDLKAIVADLESGPGIGEVEAVVAGAHNVEGLTEAAGPGGELAREVVGEGSLPEQLAVVSHQFHSCYWLKGTDQHAAGLPLRLAGYIHAEVAAVDGINVGMASVTEEYDIAGGR